MTNFPIHPGPDCRNLSFGICSGGCRIIPLRCKRSGATDPEARQRRASKWSGPGAYCSRTRRDIATTMECKGSSCGRDIQKPWRTSSHCPWSSRSLWCTRFECSGCYYHNKVSRKGKGTGEEYPNSNRQLQPGVPSQARRRHRRGEQQFFSSGGDLDA